MFFVYKSKIYKWFSSINEVLCCLLTQIMAFDSGDAFYMVKKWSKTLSIRSLDNFLWLSFFLFYLLPKHQYQYLFMNYSCNCLFLQFIIFFFLFVSIVRLNIANWRFEGVTVSSTTCGIVSSTRSIIVLLFDVFPSVWCFISISSLSEILLVHVLILWIPWWLSMRVVKELDGVLVGEEDDLEVNEL